MVSVDASSSFDTVFSAYYDGIYTFVGTLASEVDGSTQFQVVTGVTARDVSNGGNLTHQVAFQVFMSAGDVLKHKGPALSLYGYRVSDELS